MEGRVVIEVERVVAVTVRGLRGATVDTRTAVLRFGGFL